MVLCTPPDSSGSECFLRNQTKKLNKIAYYCASTPPYISNTLVNWPIWNKYLEKEMRLIWHNSCGTKPWWHSKNIFLLFRVDDQHRETHKSISVLRCFFLLYFNLHKWIWLARVFRYFWLLCPRSNFQFRSSEGLCPFVIHFCFVSYWKTFQSVQYNIDDKNKKINVKRVKIIHFRWAIGFNNNEVIHILFHIYLFPY